MDVARWQGEPVVMVVATSRALAEDACELVDVDFDELARSRRFRDGPRC